MAASTLLCHVCKFQEKNNEILNFNNRLAELQMRLDQAKSDAVKCDSKWTRLETTAAGRTLLLGQVTMYVSM